MLTKLKKYIFLLILLLTARQLCAQSYYFKHYQVENGLSNNRIFCSVQDSAGFMWFGTKDGLNRYDGYSFKTYRHDNANPKSLGNDLIYYLLNENQSQLWVGTAKGLYSYNAIGESFTLIPGTRQMSIHYLANDADGNLWIAADYRLYRYNKKQRTLFAFKDKAPFDANAIFCASDNSIWISTVQGTIEKYNKKTQLFESHFILNKKDTGSAGAISTIRETTDHQFVIGTNTQGLKLFNTRTNAVKDLITRNADNTHIYVRDMIRFSDHEFWAGTESGIYIYNHNTGKITNLHKEYSNPYSLSDNAIYTLCRDKEGGIWSGGYFGGINYYSPQYSLFTKYFPMQHANSISGSHVREIQKDKNGILWIGTEDAGLNRLNLKTGIFSRFLPDGSKNSIAYSNVHGLLVDGNRLWIGTFEHGIDLMDINSGKIVKHYTAGEGNKLKTNFVITFYKTRAGDIILATTVGIYAYNRKTDDFDLIDGLPVTFYNSILESKDGTIWAGSFSEGIFTFKLNKKGFKNYRTNEGRLNRLSHYTVNSIFEDSRKNIWVTTDGGGLYQYDTIKLSFRHYAAKDSFPSNFLFRIEEDENQKLWISSSLGLIHFDPRNGAVKSYSQADGLLTNQFNYNSSFKDTDGRIYFGSLSGLISFLPLQFRAKTYNAPVYLTSFNIENEKKDIKQRDHPLSKSILYTDTIILNNDQSSFSIDFAALSYFLPEMTEYAYKMRGLYKDWEYLKTNRKVYFTKLAPGDYVFEAKALVNGSKQWSEKNARVFIRILPPLWKSPGAYILYALLFSSLVYVLIINYHNRTVRKNQRRMEIFKNEKEKEIYEAKIEFFTNVTHEIRTPLTLIKGPMEKLIEQANVFPPIEKNLKVMDRNVERLFKLTNQLLDFRKTETHGFSLNFVKANITEIIKGVCLNFHTAAEQGGFVIETHLPAADFYAYVDMEALHKILSNLIDNGIKYGQSKVIVALNMVENADDRFRIEVSNDGKLISAALHQKIFEPFFRAKETEIKTGTGIGLSISKSLAELHNGTLFMKLNNELNIFVVELPIHQRIEFNLNGKWKKE